MEPARIPRQRQTADRPARSSDLLVFLTREQNPGGDASYPSSALSQKSSSPAKATAARRRASATTRRARGSVAPAAIRSFSEFLTPRQGSLTTYVERVENIAGMNIAGMGRSARAFPSR